MAEAPRQLVLMPSFNPGPVLDRTVREVLARWPDLWVVDDGSTDGSVAVIEGLTRSHPTLRILRREANGGKGNAVLTGAESALNAGFTHALVMDCDGQHPAERIREFMEASRLRPGSMILGQPVFGPDVPRERLWGRQLSVGLARLEVLGPAVGDPLFGFRVYPLRELVRVLSRKGRGRHYDFDHEAVVRLHWSGVPSVKLPAPCRYPGKGDGGVSHFNYLRDNLRLVLLHLRLFPAWIAHLPRIFRQRRSFIEGHIEKPTPTTASAGSPGRDPDERA